MVRCSQYGCWMVLQIVMPSPSGRRYAAMTLDGEVGHDREGVGAGDDEVAAAASTSPQP